MKSFYKRKKLLIFGNYGVENVGDEAILAGLLSAIDKNNWNITVVSVNPLKTNKIHKVDTVLPLPFGIRSLLKFGTLKTLKSISSADLIIFGGGGLFQDKEKRAFAMWSYFLKICQLFNKRIALVANTIGPITKDSYKRRAKNLFNKISFFSVRDANSMKILKQLNVPESKIVLSTDAAFFLKRPRKSSLKKKEILFILHGKHTSNKQVIKIKKLVQQLKEKNEKLLFIPMQIKIANDQKLAEKLGIECFQYDNFRDVVNKISESKMVITSRLHGMILSIISEVPFVAFSSMPKVQDFIKSIGLNEFYLKSFNEKVLMNLYNKISKNRLSIIKQISKVRIKEKEKTKYILPDFF